MIKLIHKKYYGSVWGLDTENFTLGLAHVPRCEGGSFRWEALIRAREKDWGIIWKDAFKTKQEALIALDTVYTKINDGQADGLGVRVKRKP